MKEETRTRLGSVVSPSIIPFVSTGGLSPSIEEPAPPVPLKRKNCKYFVNGELEVARSLGDFALKRKYCRDHTWHYPSIEREILGVEGFVDDIVSPVPFVQYFHSYL